jgi:hypothetical protein
MSDAAQEPNAEGAKPRGEVAWKAHLQEIAARNERVRAAGRRERREREERAATRRMADELRTDAELARKLDPRYLR